MANSFSPKRILISRTDAIGDVVLTLPMALALKKRFPDVTIGFLARSYTHPVIAACEDVDEIVDADKLKETREAAAWDAIIHVFPSPRVAEWAKAAKIPLRVGTTNRLYHWWTCNRLTRLSRKRSDLHEAQLNMRLLEPLGMTRKYSVEDLGRMIRLMPTAAVPYAAKEFLTGPQQKVVLHPSSRGSAREWSLENFAALARKLSNGGFAVAVTGVESDREILQPLLSETAGMATDFVGALSLGELMTFIKSCDGLVAASTGPLHLAGVLQTATVGLYPPERPMHDGRWAPLGPFVETLTGNMLKSSQSMGTLEGISPEDVASALMRQIRKQVSAASISF